MIEQAIHHHNRGELEQAARLYRQVLADDPKHTEAMHLLGLVMLRQGDLAGGQKLLSDAVELAPDNDRIQTSLGELLLGRGRFEAAESHFESAVRYNPNNADALSGLGVCRLRREAFEDAIDAFDRALLASAAHPIANTQRGLIYLHQGQLDLAAEHIRTALKSAPAYTPARLALAQVLMNQKAPGLALSAVEQVLEDKPDNVQAQRLAAELLLLNGRHDACAALLNRLRQSLGDDDHLLRLQGDLARATNRPREALSCYQRAIQMARKQTLLAERLAEMHGVLGQWAQAEAIWRQFVDQQPESALWRIRLAEALARQDKDQDARQHLPARDGLSGEDRENAAHLAGELALRAGEIESAVKELEAVRDSKDPRIGCMLASLKLRQNAPAEAETYAREVVERDSSTRQGMVKVLARRLLALALDEQKRYDEAAKMLFQPDNGVAHPHVAGLREQAQRLRAREPVEANAAATTPWFLVGFGGSGLETVSKALSQAADTKVLADRLGFEPRNDVLTRHNPGEAPERDDPDSIEQANRRYWRNVRRLTGETKHLIDVLPAGRANPEVLARHFPGAHVIVLRRDAADVVLQNALWSNGTEMPTARMLEVTRALFDVHEAADGRVHLNYHWLDFDALAANPDALATEMGALGFELGRDAVEAFASGLQDDYGLPAYLPAGHSEHYRSALGDGPA